jgi:hypothetical protein
MQRHPSQPQSSGQPVPVILITYATTEDASAKPSLQCAATV